MKVSLNKIFNSIVASFAMAGGLPLDQAKRCAEGLPPDPTKPMSIGQPIRFM